jgi:aspartyl-tRNA(Asn)/glutamyl-tRNA(Gln) amidotransferase subunit A
MHNLAFATIAELKELLATGKLSPDELLSFTIERCNRYNPSLGAALEIFKAESISAASPATNGILQSIPGLAKDNIAQAQRSLTCASRILENFVSPYDATVIERLKKAGALLVGRANMDEFAMGSSGETSAFGLTKNPWDTTRVPGGSSSGSAVSVAAGLVPWALGSDTGGSVRQPAALCGIYGLKPTYGLVSRSGLVAYGSSLDQVGVFARTAYDTALVLSAIAGKDERDSTTLAVAPQDYTLGLDGKLPENFTIGIVENALYADGMDPEIVAAIEASLAEFERLGARIKRIQMPTLEYVAAAYFIISRAEAASNLARFDGVRYGLRAQDVDTLKELYFKTRRQGFGPEVRARIMIGNYVLSAGHADAFYGCAKKVQRLIRHEFVKAFEDVSMLVLPTHPAPAFTFGAFDQDKLQLDLQDYFTCAMNLSGNPAVSIPCGMTSGRLPIGMQLVGPHLGEALMLKAAHAFERNTAWHTMHPNLS